MQDSLLPGNHVRWLIRELCATVVLWWSEWRKSVVGRSRSGVGAGKAGGGAVDGERWREVGVRLGGAMVGRLDLLLLLLSAGNCWNRGGGGRGGRLCGAGIAGVIGETIRGSIWPSSCLHTKFLGQSRHDGREGRPVGRWGSVRVRGGRSV